MQEANHDWVKTSEILSQNKSSPFQTVISHILFHKWEATNVYYPIYSKHITFFYHPFMHLLVPTRFIFYKMTFVYHKFLKILTFQIPCVAVQNHL